MENKLHRTQSDKIIAGVCGGLGEHFKIDPTLIRLVFVLLFLMGGHGLLIYLILWIIMPIENNAPKIVDVPSRDQQPQA